MNLRVYDIFKSKLIEQEASLVLEYFDSKAEEKFTQKKDAFATKQDISEAKVDLIKWMVGLLLGQTALILSIIKLFGV